MRLAQIVGGIALIGTITNCGGSPANDNVEGTKVVRLTGPGVRYSTLPSDFVEQSRELIQGTKTADGGCAFSVADTGMPGKILDWQTVEKDMTTCRIVIARGSRSQGA